MNNGICSVKTSATEQDPCAYSYLQALMRSMGSWGDLPCSGLHSNAPKPTQALLHGAGLQGVWNTQRHHFHFPISKCSSWTERESKNDRSNEWLGFHRQRTNRHCEILTGSMSLVYRLSSSKEVTEHQIKATLQIFLHPSLLSKPVSEFYKWHHRLFHKVKAFYTTELPSYMLFLLAYLQQALNQSIKLRSFYRQFWLDPW